MTHETEIFWWAYKHTNGSIQVKRFFDQRDISEARESQFVTTTAGPFPAKDRETAVAAAKLRLK